LVLALVLVLVSWAAGALSAILSLEQQYHLLVLVEG
jgi:hypothetical protein